MERVSTLINMKDSDNNSIVLGLFYAIVVVVGFLVIFHFLVKLPKNLQKKPDLEPFDDGTQTTQIGQENNPIQNDVLPEIKQEMIQSGNENRACEWKLDKTKTIYKQFEPVYYPAGLGENQYISRDFVCYREHAGDIEFMSKRPHCMACTVNNDDTIDRVTRTNITTTCVYSETPDPSGTIWSKEQCESSCKVLQEKMNG
jgi:hypothetical protein